MRIKSFLILTMILFSSLEFRNVQSAGPAVISAIKILGKIAGTAVTIYEFTSGGSWTEGHAADKKQKPEAKITKLMGPAGEIMVGDVFTVYGEAEVSLGNIIDKNPVMMPEIWQDAFVTITLKLHSTGKTKQYKYIFSPYANFPTPHAALARYHRKYGRKTMWETRLIEVKDDSQKINLDFTFRVEAFKEGMDNVTASVWVKGPVGDPWGQDKYGERKHELPLTFKTKEELEVDIIPGSKKVQHGDTFNVEMYVKNIGLYPVKIIYAQVGGTQTRDFILVPGERREIVEDQHPHTQPHPAGTTIKDAIVVEPIRFTSVLKLKNSKSVHLHEYWAKQPEKAECTNPHDEDLPPVTYTPAYGTSFHIPTIKSDPPIFGTIIDSTSNETISGANLTLTNLFENTTLTTNTDEEGKFVFNVANNTDWILSIEKEGFDPSYEYVSVSDEVDLEILPLDRRFYSINGRVIDDNGTPVSSLVKFESDTRTFLGFTDNATGIFDVIEIPYGEHGILTITADPPTLSDYRYFEESVREVHVEDNQYLGNISLQLKAPPSPPILVKLGGHVVEENKLSGVPNALVEVVSATTDSTIISVFTDEIGVWSTEILTGSQIKLRVSLENVTVNSPIFTVYADLFIPEMDIPIIIYPPMSILDYIEQKKDEIVQLEILYNDLLGTHENLYDDYTEVALNYENILNNYQVLEDSYTNLRQSHDTLNLNNESLLNEIAIIRNRTNIFIATTIIVVAITVWRELSYRKQKNSIN